MHEAVVVCIGRKSLRSFLARGTTKERYTVNTEELQIYVRRVAAGRKVFLRDILMRYFKQIARLQRHDVHVN